MSTSAPNPKKFEPIKLYHGLSGWPPAGPNVFRWQEGQLTYRLHGPSLGAPGQDKTVTPTTAQWEEFWRVCDEIDVWSWPSTSDDNVPVGMRVCDGLKWITELEIGSRRVTSQGQAHGLPDFQAKLMRLHRALQTMAGWRSPTEDD